MEFKQWIASELKQCSSDIASAKGQLKKLKQDKKEIEKSVRAAKKEKDTDAASRCEEHLQNNKFSITKTESDVTKLKRKQEELKFFHKHEPVRLKTGAVILSSYLKNFKKKLESHKLTFTYTQYEDGLKISYSGKSSEGAFILNGYVFMSLNVPNEVELPLFEEGEVLECSIHS